LQLKHRLSRIIVRKRTTSGLQKIKRNDHGANMWDLIHKKSGRSYEHFFYHKTLNSAAYSGLIHYLKEVEGINPDTVCMIGETQKQKNFPHNHRESFAGGGRLVNPVITEDNTEEHGDRVHIWEGLDVIDLKEYKKTHKFTVTRSRGSYDSGAKVWDVTNQGFSFPYTEAELDRMCMKPENVYWAGDIIGYKGIRKVKLASAEYGHVRIGGRMKNADQTFTTTGNKIGLIVAKRYPKGTPHISELFDQVDEMIDNEEIYLWNPGTNKKIPWSEVPKGSRGEKDIRNINIDFVNNITGEASDSDKYGEQRLGYLRLFSAEQAQALKTNNSALLKLPNGGFGMLDPYGNPRVANSKVPRVVMFCPRQMICAVELYFNLKEDTEGSNYEMRLNTTTKSNERYYKNESWCFNENVKCGNVNYEETMDSVVMLSFRKNPQWTSVTDWKKYWTNYTSGEEFENNFTRPMKKMFYNTSGQNFSLDYESLLDLPEIKDIGRHVQSGDVDALMAIMNEVKVDYRDDYYRDKIINVDLKWKSCSVLWGDLVHRDIVEMFVDRWHRISDTIYDALFHFHPDTRLKVKQLKEGFDDSNSKIIEDDGEKTLWIRHDAKGKKPNMSMINCIKQVPKGGNHWQVPDEISPIKTEDLEIKEIEGKEYVMMPMLLDRRWRDNTVRIINEYEWEEIGEGIRTKVTKPTLYQSWEEYKRS
jgi:hypothetical protein